MRIDHLDHIVLTVADISATIAFYSRVLGMQEITFGDQRKALAFGQQKINLHPAGCPIAPHAASCWRWPRMIRRYNGHDR